MYNVLYDFRLALGRTAEACSSIALELTSHEMGIENLVLAPYNSALEVSINHRLLPFKCLWLLSIPFLLSFQPIHTFPHFFPPPCPPCPPPPSFPFPFPITGITLPFPFLLSPSLLFSVLFSFLLPSPSSRYPIPFPSCSFQVYLEDDTNVTEMQ